MARRARAIKAPVGFRARGNAGFESRLASALRQRHAGDPEGVDKRWVGSAGASTEEPAELEAFFGSGPARVGELIARLGREDAVSLPLLTEAWRRRLLDEAQTLSFEAAAPIVGEGERIVRQEFTYCTGFPRESAFRETAGALERLVNLALARLNPPPLAPFFPFNDLILQRYPPGSIGITPHRDHLRYVGLIAILILSGQARFAICSDRSGWLAREIAAAPGDLLLMRAPGFEGRRDRPFHFVADVAALRYSFGVRHDQAVAGFAE